MIDGAVHIYSVLASCNYIVYIWYMWKLVHLITGAITGFLLIVVSLKQYLIITSKVFVAPLNDIVIYNV